MSDQADTLCQAITDHQSGRLAQAERLYRAILHQQPDHVGALNGLAVLARQVGRGDAAVALLGRAIAQAPDNTVPRANLGATLRGLGRADEAALELQRALVLAPDQADALNNLGMVLQGQAQAAAAVRCFRRALSLAPDHAEARANLAYYSQCLPEVTLAMVDRLQRAMAPQGDGAVMPPRVARSAAGQSWSLGFVSGDFRHHQVAAYVVRGLEGLAALGCRIVLYANQVEADAMTERLRAIASLWRPIAGLSDAAVVDLVRSDGIEVLVDLSGHFSRHRLGVFAQRAAPLQVTWAGYMATTGLDEMDLLIADAREVPPGAELHYSERVVRLPQAWICWDPPADMAEPGPLPAGPITFGSLNMPAKLNDPLLALWARVLHAVPGSRLLLRYTGLDAPGVGARLKAALAAQGIAPERLSLEGWGAQRDFLETYQRIHIALDPFPYSGSITTCEALWMGVPVITLPGETFAGRHSLSILHAVGLGELAAADADAYVRKAAALAADRDALSRLRSGLRARVAASPLCDGAGFAADFLAALSSSW